MLRVLQVNKYYSPWIGGIETVVQQIAEGLKSKYQMTVLACDDGLEQPRLLEGINVVKTKRWGVLFNMPLSIDFFKQFKNLVAENDIIHVHLPFPLATLAAFIYRKKLVGKKIVVTYHSDIVRTKVLGFLYKPLLLWFLKRSEIIVTTSEILRDNSKILQRFKNKTVIVPLSIISLPVTHPSNKKDFILFVGRLVKYKGPEYLIKALVGTSEKLKIVGTGPLESSLRELTDSLGLSTQIEFLGSISNEELSVLYDEAKIFVLPSISNNEAFGIVQVEAMSYYTPIINTKLPTGVPWVARDGIEAITVEPKNPDALKAAIVKLSSDPRLRYILSQQARLRVENSFLPHVMLSAYEKVYNTTK